MTTTHNLGYPRIGAQRELKWALESYWNGASSLSHLQQTGKELRRRHWQRQARSGLDLIPVGDFSWYDSILDLSAMLGAVPARFGWQGGDVDLDTYFRMARGQAPTGNPAAACAMTKWFDTNYHYIVPEFTPGQCFVLSSHRLFDEIREAQSLGHRVKPVLPGPLTYLWLGKIKGENRKNQSPSQCGKLDLLDALIPAYGEILIQLQRLGIEWVQLDEPILALDLPSPWKSAFEAVYTRLKVPGLHCLLATYFGALQDNLSLACGLPVEGLHIDAVRAPHDVDTVLDWLPNYKILSIGLVDGRNIWRTDLDTALRRLRAWQRRLGARLWLAPSCSLLHVPDDLAAETTLDRECRSWLAFAIQKLDEVEILRRALDESHAEVDKALLHSRRAILSRAHSPRVYRDDVRSRMRGVTQAMTLRTSPYQVRAEQQRAWLNLPEFPTTTIGSFPQTAQIRQARREYKQRQIDHDAYQAVIHGEIRLAVTKQEQLGLDVLVHGEAERNDMVEYFGEHLDGFAITRNGWVQSYGSRCVKPPILFGDVGRPSAITLEWTVFAQSLTGKPMKGMLTGPVTILNWSFVRDDQPRADTCLQIALALRDEVLDLERAGIGIIQIDEAALREGLPLRESAWPDYLAWTIRAFRVAACGVLDRTQIHTHMCYSQFNDIISAIAAMDADVITIETSRSDMELLNVFEAYEYPNEIGPGVYDIHSPNVPGVTQIVALLEKAAGHIPARRLWVNPDCGLKTRGWAEVEEALGNMLKAAHIMRERKIQETPFGADGVKPER